MLFRFEYDILDNNMIPREEFDDKNFFKLLGDILVDIIDRQENLNIGYTNNREDIISNLIYNEDYAEKSITFYQG